MEDVKKRHLDEIIAEKILRDEEEKKKKSYNELFNKWKSDWRNELKEDSGMTVAGSFLTTDDTILDKPVNSDNQSQIIGRGGRGSFNSTSSWNPFDSGTTGFNAGYGFADNGTGTGQFGGFDMSPTAAELDQYLAFGFAANSNPGGVNYPDAQSQNMNLNLKDVDTISAFVIRGNGSNGGTTPPEDSSGIIIQYFVNGGFRDVNFKPDGSDSGLSATLVPTGSTDDDFTTGKNVVYTIPSYIKNSSGMANIRFIVRNAGFSLSPTFGVRNLTFQQRTPRNVFVSLDNPEATSFIRVGTREGDPKKRRKNVEDILRAGQQYTNNQFDNTFPGSTTTLYEPKASPLGFDQLKDMLQPYSGTRSENDSYVDVVKKVSGYDSYSDELIPLVNKVYPGYQTKLKNVVKTFDNFESKYGQSVLGNNDKLLNDIESRFTPLAIKQAQGKPIMSNPAQFRYATGGSIEDLLRDPGEKEFKEIFITPNGEIYKRANRVYDENGNSVIGAQHDAISKAERETHLAIRKYDEDLRYRIGVEEYKRELESLQSYYKKSLAERGYPPFAEYPAYDARKADSSGRHRQRHLFYYTKGQTEFDIPEKKEWVDAFAGVDNVYAKAKEPFLKAREALNRKIIRINGDGTPYDYSYMAFAPFPPGHVLTPADVDAAQARMNALYNIEPAFASDGEETKPQGSDTNVDSGTETKPQGLARVLAGIADIATGQKFDFDKRGQELINKNFDEVIKDKSANIGTAARLYKDYLGNKTDSGFVANNQYLGKEYINNTFLPNARFYNDSTHVGDNVVGNGQASTYNANTGRIKTTATFDFKTNAQEMEDRILTPRQKLFVKSLPALGTYKNVGLDYTLDSTPALTGTGLDTAAGAVFSAITSVAKQSGRGKTVPIEVEYTPRELYNKNPAGYTQLVDQGVIPDVMRVKYGHLYDTPYFKFKRASKKSKVNESYSKSKSRLMKPKQFFNPKDIKPEFPPEPPEEIDPNTGMHPRYGKHAARYKKT